MSNIVYVSGTFTNGSGIYTNNNFRIAVIHNINVSAFQIDKNGFEVRLERKVNDNWISENLNVFSGQLKVYITQSGQTMKSIGNASSSIVTSGTYWTDAFPVKYNTTTGTATIHLKFEWYENNYNSRKIKYTFDNDVSLSPIEITAPTLSITSIVPHRNTGVIDFSFSFGHADYAYTVYLVIKDSTGKIIYWVQSNAQYYAGIISYNKTISLTPAQKYIIYGTVTAANGKQIELNTEYFFKGIVKSITAPYLLLNLSDVNNASATISDYIKALSDNDTIPEITSYDITKVSGTATSLSNGTITAISVGTDTYKITSDDEFSGSLTAEGVIWTVEVIDNNTYPDFKISKYGEYVSGTWVWEVKTLDVELMDKIKVALALHSESSALTLYKRYSTNIYDIKNLMIAISSAIHNIDNTVTIPNPLDTNENNNWKSIVEQWLQVLSDNVVT